MHILLKVVAQQCLHRCHCLLQALGQYSTSVQDLEAALTIQPDNQEVCSALAGYTATGLNCDSHTATWKCLSRPLHMSCGCVGPTTTFPFMFYYLAAGDQAAGAC